MSACTNVCFLAVKVSYWATSTPRSSIDATPDQSTPHFTHPPQQLSITHPYHLFIQLLRPLPQLLLTRRLPDIRSHHRTQIPPVVICGSHLLLGSLLRRTLEILDRLGVVEFLSWQLAWDSES